MYDYEHLSPTSGSTMEYFIFFQEFPAFAMSSLDFVSHSSLILAVVCSCSDFVLQSAGRSSRVVWFIFARSAATRLGCTGCLPFRFHHLDVDGIGKCVL
jgi:hypothetical protein